MRFTKWIFFGYLLFIGLIVATIAASFATTPPRDPKSLYTVYYDNIKSMDPAISNDTLGSAIIGNVYETLYGYKYGVVPYELYPQLAASMPKVSEDGRTYTISLHKAIHFYDPWREAFPDGVGPELKASDVIYSWKRVADFHSASPNFSTILQGRVAGIDDWNAYTEKQPDGQVDYDRPVEGLVALDDYTVQIRLTQKSPQFKYLMAHGAGSIVCRKAVEAYGDRFSNRPVGTGPYALQEHLQEQRITFVANPSYRGRPNVDGLTKVPESQRLPKIQRLQYVYFKDELPAWYLFQQKLFDVNIIPKDSFENAIDSKTGELRTAMQQRGIVLDKSPDPSIFYIGFNMGDPVVGKNKPLRQAMSMAFDRDEFIKTYLNGRGLAANGPIPPSFPTYDEKGVNPYAQLNLEAARRKVKEAEQINGGPIPVLKMQVGGTDTLERQYAEFFTSQMRQIGIEMKPDYNTWARFQERVDNRQTQVFWLGWTPDYPDEQTFFQLFYGKFAPAGGINSTAYVNPKFDALYEKSLSMDRSPERDAMYREMSGIVNEDCVWIHLYYPMVYSLHYNWIGNTKNMDYGAGYRQFFTLDSAARQKAQQLLH